MHADPLLGWGPWATGGVDVYETPGSHLTMFQEPAVLHVSKDSGRLPGGTVAYSDFTYSTRSANSSADNSPLPVTF